MINLFVAVVSCLSRSSISDSFIVCFLKGWHHPTLLSGANPSVSQVLDAAISMNSLGGKMQTVWEGLHDVEAMVLSEYTNFIIQAKVLGKNLTDSLESCELGTFLVNAVIRVASRFLKNLAKQTLGSVLQSTLKKVYSAIITVTDVGYTTVRYLSLLLVRFIGAKFLEGIIAWILQVAGGALQKWILQKVAAVAVGYCKLLNMRDTR